MTALSAHFQAAEFQSRGRPLSPASLERYTRLAVETLEPLREALGGVAISVNCGERLPDHNKDVGGELSSYHLPPEERASAHHRTNTCAADIHCATVDPTTIAQTAAALMAAGRIPPGGIGLYRHFVHIDNRGYRTRWTGK